MWEEGVAAEFGLPEGAEENHENSISSITTNKSTFCISVTLLPYTCFGCGPAIITVHQ
jgi:hypothetical protein